MEIRYPPPKPIYLPTTQDENMDDKEKLIQEIHALAQDIDTKVEYIIEKLSDLFYRKK